MKTVNNEMAANVTHSICENGLQVFINASELEFTRCFQVTCLTLPAAIATVLLLLPATGYLLHGYRRSKEVLKSYRTEGYSRVKRNLHVLSIVATCVSLCGFLLSLLSLVLSRTVFKDALGEVNLLSAEQAVLCVLFLVMACFFLAVRLSPLRYRVQVKALSFIGSTISFLGALVLTVASSIDTTNFDEVASLETLIYSGFILYLFLLITSFLFSFLSLSLLCTSSSALSYESERTEEARKLYADPQSEFEQSGPFSRLSLLWVSRMMKDGAKKALNMDDLLGLPVEYRAAEVLRKAKTAFSLEYIRTMEENGCGDSKDSKPRIRLLFLFFELFGGRFVLLGVMKFFADMLSLANPMLLNAILSNLAEAEGTGWRWVPPVCVAALFLSSLISAMLNTHYTLLSNFLGVKVRAIILYSVMEHALRLRVGGASAKDQAVAETNGDRNKKKECEEGDPAIHVTNPTVASIEFERDAAAAVRGLDSEPSTKEAASMRSLPRQSEANYRYLKELSSGSILDLMSNDTQRIMDVINSFHQLWSLPVQVAIVLYLLYTQLSYVFVAGVGVVVLLLALNIIISKRINVVSKKLMSARDRRFALTREAILNAKNVKASALEEFMCQRIAKARAKEFGYLRTVKYLDALCVYFWATTPVLVCAITFATFVLTGGSLTAANVFTSLSLFYALIFPLNAFPWILNGAIEARISIKRIQEFLSCDDFCMRNLEHDDMYDTSEKPRADLGTTNSFSMYGAVEETVASKNEQRKKHETKNGSERESHETHENDVHPSSTRRRASSSSASQRIGAVSVRACNFCWKNAGYQTGSPEVLHSVSLSIAPGSVVAVTGPVGSGKSSLLLALVGELTPVEASMTPWRVWNRASDSPNTTRSNSQTGQLSAKKRRSPFKTSRYSRFEDEMPRSAEADSLLPTRQRQFSPGADDFLPSFQVHGAPVFLGGPTSLSTQPPFLLQGSLEENITFGRPLDTARLEEVISATALDSDIKNGTLSRSSPILEGGKSLSGGQKARIGLARALYRLPSILFVDDFLSSLDGKTAQRLTASVLKFLKAHAITAVLAVSNNDRGQGFLASSDRVYFMQSGKIVCGGSFQSLVKEGYLKTFASKDREPKKSSKIEDGPLPKNNGERNSGAFRRVLSQATSPLHTRIASLPPKRSSAQTEDGSSFLERVKLTKQSSWSSFGSPRSLSSKRLTFDDAVVLEGQRDDSHTAKSSENETRVQNDVKSEEREEGHINAAVLKAYFSNIGVPLSVIILASLVLMQSSRSVSDWFLSFWVDTTANLSINASSVSNDVGLSIESRFLIIYVALAGGNTILTLVRSFSFAAGGLRAARRSHDGLLKGIVESAPLSFFHDHSSGRLLNRFSRDTVAIDEQLPFMLNIVLAQSTLLLAVLITVAIGTVWFLLAVVPLAILYVWLQRRYRSSSRELRRLDSVARSPLYERFSEALAGLPTIRAFGASARSYFLKEHARRIDQSARTIFASSAAAQWFSLRLQLIGVAVVTIVAILGVFVGGGVGGGPSAGGTSNSHGGSSAGLVGLALLYALPITGYLNGLVTSFAETEKEMVSVERILEFSTVTPEWSVLHSSTRDRTEPQPDHHRAKGRQPGVEGPLNAPPSPSKSKRSAAPEVVSPPPLSAAQVPPLWPQSGGIKLDRVSLRYHVDQSLALKNISLSIRPGEKIAVIGRTGAGKSSILMALLRLFPIESGTIVVDGVDIGSIDPRTLRRRIGYVGQEPFLFDGTLRENLLAPVMSVAELFAVEGRQSFFAKHTVEGLQLARARRIVEEIGLLDALRGRCREKDVMDIGISEGGENLSYGERLLVSLCRILLISPRIVLCDEPTSVADYAIEDRALKALGFDGDEDNGNSTALANFSSAPFLDKDRKEQQRRRPSDSGLRRSPSPFSQALSHGSSRGRESPALSISSGPTVVIIAHSLRTAKRCDRVIVIDEGQVIADGVPNEILSDPRYVRCLGEST